MKLNEFQIFKNEAIGAHIIWQFAKSYAANHTEKASPTLMLSMPILPICLNERTVNLICNRNYKEGSLIKALNDTKDIFMGLQERMEEMADLTLSSIYLASNTGLIEYNKASSEIIANTKGIPLKHYQSLSKDQQNIIDSSRRIGYWFSKLSLSEIMIYFNIRF